MLFLYISIVFNVIPTHSTHTHAPPRALSGCPTFGANFCIISRQLFLYVVCGSLVLCDNGKFYYYGNGNKYTQQQQQLIDTIALLCENRRVINHIVRFRKIKKKKKSGSKGEKRKVGR